MTVVVMVVLAAAIAAWVLAPLRRPAIPRMSGEGAAREFGP